MQKVLIVDDDVAMRRLVGKIISSMGLADISASDGARAWQIYQDNPDIVLVITDVDMPIMNGRELVSQFRASPERKDLPILIMSAVVAPREISDLLECGATAFIPKPIREEDVTEYVCRSLELALETSRAERMEGPGERTRPRSGIARQPESVTSVADRSSLRR